MLEESSCTEKQIHQLDVIPNKMTRLNLAPEESALSKKMLVAESVAVTTGNEGGSGSPYPISVSLEKRRERGKILRKGSPGGAHRTTFFAVYPYGRKYAEYIL